MLFLLGFRYVNCICLRGGLGGFEIPQLCLVSIVPELGIIIGKGGVIEFVSSRFQKRDLEHPAPGIESPFSVCSFVTMDSHI